MISAICELFAKQGIAVHSGQVLHAQRAALEADKVLEESFSLVGMWRVPETRHHEISTRGPSRRRWTFSPRQQFSLEDRLSCHLGLVYSRVLWRACCDGEIIGNILIYGLFQVE